MLHRGVIYTQPILLCVSHMPLYIYYLFMLFYYSSIPIYNMLILLLLLLILYYISFHFSLIYKISFSFFHLLYLHILLFLVCSLLVVSLVFFIYLLWNLYYNNVPILPINVLNDYSLLLLLNFALYFHYLNVLLVLTL